MPGVKLVPLGTFLFATNYAFLIDFESNVDSNSCPSGLFIK
ncbi:unnamed protein product [Acidithrix sp. C25]|nr:unnamed protein product [Acidithrix sp. C25]